MGTNTTNLSDLVGKAERKYEQRLTKWTIKYNEECAYTHVRHSLFAAEVKYAVEKPVPQLFLGGNSKMVRKL